MNFQIEKAKPEDAEGIRNVLDVTWLATYPNEESGITLEDIKHRIEKKKEDGAVEKLRETLSKTQDNKLSLVAKSGEVVVGVCNLVKNEDKNQLQAIYVMPDFQGKGIGRTFWAEALKFLDPMKDTYVEVAEYNQNAINFYKSLGFEDTGRRFQYERFRMQSGSILPEMEMIRKSGL